MATQLQTVAAHVQTLSLNLMNLIISIHNTIYKMSVTNPVNQHQYKPWRSSYFVKLGATVSSMLEYCYKSLLLVFLFLSFLDILVLAQEIPVL